MPSSPDPWSCRTPQPPRPTLNALSPCRIETDAEATARHLHTCRELAELGMQVARDAARETVRNLDAPIEHPMPLAASPPACRIADPGRLFARICHAVRQTIALEIRIRAKRASPAPLPLRIATPAAKRRVSYIGVENRPVGEILSAIRSVLAANTT